MLHLPSPVLRRFAALFAVLSLVVTLSAAEAPRKTFDIAAGDAATTLKQFTEQSGEQVVYLVNNVRGVSTKPVTGELTAREALDRLLAGTDLVLVQDEKTGAFTINRSPAEAKNVPSRLAETDATAAASTGSVQGDVMLGNDAVAGARVSFVDVSGFALTDSFGEFRFDDVPPGTHDLIVEGESIARMRVTGVTVNPGRVLSLATISARSRSRDLLGQKDLVINAEKLEEMYKLDKLQVNAAKPEPYVGANLDLPRTENDAQPYYIYDSAQIEQSGALGVVDFFQKFVPMNYRKAVLEQTPTANNGATSIFSLFGPIGQNQTLVLVNGRTQANVIIGGTNQQPDVNGIPISAIDHIEILPASASAIYGGNAMGGVINIVLKQNYVGGDLRLNYEHATGTDASVKSATATAGLTLEGGKTHVFFSASYTERPQLFLEDRGFLVDYLRRWQATNYGSNDPYSPLLGSTTNITTYSSSNLTLKSAYGGTNLGSSITHLPAGYQGVPASGVAGLVSNAGTYNTDLPANSASAFYNGYGAGLRTPLAQGIRLRGMSLSLRRLMRPNLEAYANFDFRANHSVSDVNSADGMILTLPASAPTNPFTSTVYLNVPVANAKRGLVSDSETRDFVAGVKLSLPHDWTAIGEFHLAQTGFDYSQWSISTSRLNADIASGAFDILRDLQGLGLDFSAYRGLTTSHNVSTLTEFTTHASGTLWELPGGPLRSTIIAGTRKQGNRTGVQLTEFENYASDFSRTITLPRHTVDDSAGAELNVPIFGRKFTFPLLQSLELQLAARVDDYHAYQRAYSGNFTSTITTRSVASSDSHYRSDNQTVGLTWKPVRDVMIRGSYSTAFTPPDPSDLLPTTTTTPYTTTITDPLRGNSRYTVSYLGSGNPDLKPEESESATIGVVFTPRWVPGLRLSADYARIERDNARGSLSVQQIVNYESDFPDRVTRAAATSGDTYSSGAITFVDTSYLNLFKTQSVAYNFRASYSLRTSAGNWSFDGVASTLQHYRVQTIFGAPLVEMIGNENQASYLIPKLKGNGTISWEKGAWRLGWTTRYYSRYLQSAYYQEAQGSRYIPSQTYHDIYAGYRIPNRSVSGRDLTRWLTNTTIQVGVKNVFNTKPPYDASASSGLPYSPYGDLRLASYWLSLKKEF